MALRFQLLLLAISVCPGLAKGDPPSPPSGFEPKTPAQSLNALRLSPDLQADLAAYEPLVHDPIAVAWGPDGRMWVVEMGDYPLGTDGKGGAGGRIKILTDTDGDGRYDKATVFLDGLLHPTAVLPWKKGALIACAPDVFYAEDADGDGKAEIKKVLLTGFGKGNQQHLVNGLRWGLDNWVHGANGDGGAGANGVVKSLLTGQEVDIRGRNFRFRPDDGALEPTTGVTQFGHHPDNWGEWFGSNNAQPLYHFLLPERYLKRNLRVVPPDPRVQLVPVNTPLFSRARPLPVRGEAIPAPTKVYPTSFTSACSGAVYRDELLGPKFARSVFICDPATSLVHREVLTPKGPTFSASRPDEEKDSEFFASQDPWCRPTMALAGPDGALYVVDMYRLVIEHPQWIAPETKAKLDLRAGHDMGRIYRIYPFDKRPRRVPRLDKLNTAELVAALESPSGWQRDMVQQMLLWRADPTAAKPLESMAKSGKRPEARLHALCTLDGLSGLSPELLKSILNDEHPGVRRHAIRLAENFLDKSPTLGEALSKATSDPDPTVRLQLAFSLGFWDDARAGNALAELLQKDGTDRYVVAAVMTALRPAQIDAALNVLDKLSDTAREGVLDLAAAGDQGVVARLLDRLAASGPDGKAPSFGAVAGLLDGLKRSKSPGKLPDSTKQHLKRLFAQARQAAADDKSPLETRLGAARLLGHGSDVPAQDQTVLTSLLVPQSPPELQATAIASLAASGGATSAESLLRPWGGYGPNQRQLVLSNLLSREAWTLVLLKHLAAGDVLPADLDAAAQQRLLKHPSDAVRGQAAKLFAARTSDRGKVVEAFRPALALKGEPGQGREIFAKHCATCHRVGELGQPVGPDIGGFAQKPAEALLVAILDPNQAVEPRYRSYVAATSGGRVITGILANETAAGITLIDSQGKRQDVLRTDLEELRALGQSLMPEGMEKSLSPQNMADLIAFLRPSKGTGKTVAAVNRPELVRPGADGGLRLLATNAALKGKKIGLNAANACIAWMQEGDEATWKVEVPRSGLYEVRIHWAQVEANAGNPFELIGGDSRLSGKFPSTGGWEQYRFESFGRVRLTAGQRELRLRPSGPVREELSDLREIRLIYLEP